MQNISGSFNCKCCGKPVVDAVLHNSDFYGKTCISKLQGKSAAKSKAVFIPAKRISFDDSGFMHKAVYEIDGISKKFAVSYPRLSASEELPESAIMVINHNGKLCVKDLHFHIKTRILTYTCHSTGKIEEVTLTQN